ncbi:MAG: Flp pilus assembly protein CpaB [Anaerolineae bacterium]|nr:Flp pilus assembly protein CpaB [Anaerolineae bacterium]
MKRRNWLWFGASGILAVAAGVLAILALNWAARSQAPVVEEQRQFVVVARNPIGARSLIRTDNVTLEERSEIPSGALLDVGEVVGRRALRDMAQGEVIRVQDVEVITGTRDLALLLENDTMAVAVPADDVLGGWGAVLPGDHVDVLFTIDVILETPMYPEETITLQEGETIQRLDRDQSLDNVSVLTLQNLEVLRILEEPVPEGAATQQAQTEQVAPPKRALLLKVDPQDAVVLKYLLDSQGKIDLALRSPTNETLFDVDAVNINYLLLRYGMALPEQPE